MKIKRILGCYVSVLLYLKTHALLTIIDMSRHSSEMISNNTGFRGIATNLTHKNSHPCIRSFSVPQAKDNYLVYVCILILSCHIQVSKRGVQVIKWSQVQGSVKKRKTRSDALSEEVRKLVHDFWAGPEVSCRTGNKKHTN